MQIFHEQLRIEGCDFMKEHKYTICNQPDEDIFNRQCEAIKLHVPITMKFEPIIDTDGSKYQRYKLNESEIVVFIDYEVGYVGVESDVELTQYFKTQGKM